ncbi:MAG: dihydroorotase [Opitutales bacterium]|nr:dihydroorotase [Opitutales bacterium]
MSKLIWIKNGRVIDPANKRDGVGDVFIRDGKVCAQPDAEALKRAEVIDAKDLIVAPGLVDIHVHLREPGQTHKEDIRSGSRAAAAGGFTSIVCMPNTTPPADNPGTIRRIMDSCERNAVVNIYPTGCLTIGMKGEQLAPFGSLHAEGIVAVTDDGLCVQNNEIMRRALEYAQHFNLPIMDHCQDMSMTRGSVMNEGYWSLRLGLKGWPSAAEDLIIARNVVLSQHTGAHIHMQHVSSAYGVDILRRAKQRGVRVTGEAMPHHVYFTDEACKTYNTNFKMNPPLRSERDRDAVIEGVLDGSLDIIATDHAPHAPDEKDCEFDTAPFGIIGMETALASCLEVFVHRKLCDLPFLISRLTHRPAEILGLPKGTLSEGVDGDVVIFDPNESWTVDPLHFRSKSSNCPWNGETLRGRVKRTLVAGETVWLDAPGFTI